MEVDLSCNQDVHARAERTYLNTNIDGNATVVVGDNHGTIVSHYHQQSPSDKEKTYKLLLNSLSFEGMGARLRNVDPALSKSCQWLHQHQYFISWVNPDRVQSSDDFLWILGKPGSGKSTIMRDTLLWAEKERPASPTVSYFFDARSPYQLAKNTAGLYRSILHQLLSCCPRICDLFIHRFRSKISLEVVDAWTEKEIQNFLNELIDTAEIPSLTIFVDALDESPDDDIQEMIAYFEDLQQRATHSDVRLRICFASRHYPSVSIVGNPITLEDQQGHVQAIEQYVRARLAGGSQIGMSEVRQRLLKKAAGVFLWVALMIQMLNRCFNRGEGVSAMMEELERASPKIQDLFFDILAREQDGMDDCITLLRFVLCAKRPLTPQELYRAVRKTWRIGSSETCPSNADTISRYLLTCSRGLVEYTKSRPPTIQLIHETIRETLIAINLQQTSRNLRKFPLPLDFRAEVCHTSIAEICLRCLLSFCVQQRPDIGDGDRRAILDLELFAAYAAEFWWQHMQKTTGPSRQSLLRLASGLLTDDRTRFVWLQLHDIDTTKSNIPGDERKHDTYGTPLYYAVSVGLPDLVQEFIAAGVDINIKGGYRDSPLGAAVFWTYTEIVQILLEAGAEINEEPNFNDLGNAVRRNSKQVLKLLLEHDARVDLIIGRGSVLAQAVLMGHQDMALLLLEYNADPDFCNANFGPLELAVHDGDTKMACALLERGADPNSSGIGWFLLDKAFKTRNWALVQLLLEWNANVNPHNFPQQLKVLKAYGKWDLAALLEKSNPKKGNRKNR